MSATAKQKNTNHLYWKARSVGSIVEKWLINYLNTTNTFLMVSAAKN